MCTDGHQRPLPTLRLRSPHHERRALLPDDRLATRPVGIVAIYSAIGLRDDTLNARVGKALMGGPMQWAAVKHLRRDPHEESASCWIHGSTWCWSKE